MCGIAGYVGHGSRDILEQMTNTLTHRGPDDAGFFVSGAVGLGHRRLSIIDLSPAGRQPMQNANGTATIIFNGEIYNFQALRDELKKTGYPFRGGSDTEVILAAYQAYGLACFKKMNGMFALALYDAPQDRLVLARDRLGKKPLYWGRFGGTLVFGSELKAVLEHSAVKKEIDPLSLQKYFAFDYVPTPHTMFKNIFKLEPGQYLVYEKGVIEKKTFWQLSFDNRHDVAESDVLQELDGQLERAVASRLVSDVPLGIFLSGGLDSSTIAYYAQKASTQKIKTFSIGFTESSFDESSYAREVAAHLGTDHHERMVTPEQAQAVIPEIASILDEPVADYSIIPTLLLSRFTRGSATVALGGDGGDELFYGYPTFQAERLMGLLHNPVAKNLLTLLKNASPSSHNHFHLRFKLERLLVGIESDPRHRHHDWMGTFGKAQREALIGFSRGNIYEDIDRYFALFAAANRFQQLSGVYLRTYLMDQVLVKVDRASMAASLEVRAPFLDYEFVDFVNSLDTKYKIHGWSTKYLLKKLMAGKLPHQIIYRKKQGFAVPLAAWFAGPLRPWVESVLSPERLRSSGLLNAEAVTQIVKQHMSGAEDRRKELWSLLTFQLWYETWGQ